MTKLTKRKTAIKRILVLLMLYIFLFITIFLFLDFYDFYAINPYLLLIFSVIAGCISTYVHIRNGGRNRMDDIVDKL